MWRMGQDYGGFYLPHYPCYQTQGGQIIEDLKVIADRMMKMSSKDAGGGLRLGQSDSTCFLCAHFDRPAVAG